MQGVVLLNSVRLPRLGSQAPREVRLFKWGKNKTTKGEFFLTKESAAACLAEYSEQGHALTWDYDHATFTSADPQHRVAAGSCRLAARDDGLWAVDIAWTADAKRDIEAGKWVFASPALKFNDRRVITGIRNIALTNIPATHDAAPLLLSARNAPMNQYLKDMRAGAEAMMGAAQAMTGEGQTDQKVKELGSKTIESLTPLIAMLEEMIEAAGEGAEGEGELSALRGLRVLCGELLSIKDGSIPELRGKLRALVQKSKVAVTSAKDAEKTAVLSMVAANMNKIPAAERAAYEALPLAELQAYLSDAPVLVSSAPVQQKDSPVVPKSKDEAEVDAGLSEILSAVNRGKRTAPGAAASAEDADAADILNKVNRRAQAQA